MVPGIQQLFYQAGYSKGSVASPGANQGPVWRPTEYAEFGQAKPPEVTFKTLKAEILHTFFFSSSY